MKLEANPVNGLSNDIFNFHLGSTGCSTTGGVTTCTQPNRVKMSFDFNPKTQKIVLDYSKLLTDVAVDKNLGGAAGCMSALNDPECMSTTGKMMNKIGLNDAGALGVCIGGECAANQQLFSIKSK